MTSDDLIFAYWLSRNHFRSTQRWHLTLAYLQSRASRLTDDKECEER
jgi:hypothetical protein